MRLEPLSEQYFESLIRWIPDSEQMYLWSGATYSFPLDFTQIKQHCAKPEVNGFILLSDDKPVGFVELYRITKHHYRVCRVIVAKEQRGKGISKRMLTLAIEKSIEEFGAFKLSLGVFERNPIARQCYQKLGFKAISIDRTSRVVDGIPWPLINMEKWLISKQLRQLLNIKRF